MKLTTLHHTFSHGLYQYPSPNTSSEPLFSALNGEYFSGDCYTCGTVRYAVWFVMVSVVCPIRLRTSSGLRSLAT